jgi:putative Ig domain-containing protein
MAPTQSSLTFITESLPDFPVGVPKQVVLEVSGGTPPYRFEITQGTLPRALRLSIRGRISGVARREADTTVFIKVTDKAGASLTQAFAVRATAP